MCPPKKTMVAIVFLLISYMRLENVVVSKADGIARWIAWGAPKLENVVGHSDFALAALFASLRLKPWLMHSIGSTSIRSTFSTCTRLRFHSLDWWCSVFFLCEQRQQGEGHPVTLQCIHQFVVKCQSACWIPLRAEPASADVHLSLRWSCNAYTWPLSQTRPPAYNFGSGFCHKRLPLNLYLTPRLNPSNGSSATLCASQIWPPRVLQQNAWNTF